MSDQPNFDPINPFRYFEKHLLKSFFVKYLHPCELMLLRLVDSYFYLMLKDYHLTYMRGNDSIILYAHMVKSESLINALGWLAPINPLTKQLQNLAKFEYNSSEKMKLPKFLNETIVNTTIRVDDNSITGRILTAFSNRGPITAVIQIFYPNETANDKLMSRLFLGMCDRFDRNDVMNSDAFESNIRYHMTAKEVARYTKSYRNNDYREDIDIFNEALLINHPIAELYHHSMTIGGRVPRLKEGYVNPDNETLITKVLRMKIKYDLDDRLPESIEAMTNEEFTLEFERYIGDMERVIFPTEDQDDTDFQTNYNVIMNLIPLLLKCKTSAKFRLTLQLRPQLYNPDTDFIEECVVNTINTRWEDIIDLVLWMNQSHDYCLFKIYACWQNKHRMHCIDIAFWVKAIELDLFPEELTYDELVERLIEEIQESHNNPKLKYMLNIYNYIPQLLAKFETPEVPLALARLIYNELIDETQYCLSVETHFHLRRLKRQLKF